jgi:hypothetical protein
VGLAKSLDLIRTIEVWSDIIGGSRGFSVKRKPEDCSQVRNVS